MATEIKQLSTGTYTLICNGPGSVNTSLGIATSAAPLTFTLTETTYVRFETVGVVDRWQLTASAYPLPYTPPGTTQTSTAHNGTSGIHYSMPQDGAVWNQLSLAKPLTLAARIVMGMGSAGLPIGNYGIFSSVGSQVGELYVDDGPNAKSYDKTTGIQRPISSWSRYEQLILCTQVNTAGTQFRVGVYRVAAKTWSWSSLVAYDGSFNPSAVYQKLMIAFSNNYPMWHIRHWLADYQASDSDILSAMGVAA